MTGPFVEAPSPIAAGQAQEQNTADHAIIADEAAARAAVKAQDKRIKTLQARAALAGVAVHIVSTPAGGSELLASRWAFAKRFDSVDALEAWLQRVGVQS